MLNKRSLQIFLLLTLLMHATGGTAAVYKWVDKDGNVKYGDRPPPEVEKSKEVEIRDQGTPSESNQVNRQQARERLLQQYQKEREEKKQKAAKERKAKKKRKARCHYARTKLTEYMEHGRLYKRLPNQERSYLTDKERDAEIAKARAEVKKWCK